MKRLWPILLFLLLLILAGCASGETEVIDTPTAFPAAIITLRPISSEPINLALPVLAANPELFQGVTLRLGGEYRPLPRLVCERDPHPSPATWGLVDEGLMANAAGFDSQLRALLQEGQRITVEGRWLRWRGPVGCGKQARVQDVWYLSASRIVEPHPLTLSATAAPEVTSPPLVPPTTTESPTGTPTATLTAESVTVSPTTVLQPTQPLLPTATLPPAVAPTASNTPPTVSVPLTATPGLAGTATATVSGTTTVTPTAGTPGTGTTSPTPTAANGTPGDGALDRGDLDFEDLVIDRLNGDQGHSWSFELSASDTITVTVAPAIVQADVSFSILDNTGATLLSSHNQAGPGAIETLTAFSIGQPGSYRLVVVAITPEPTDYALMIMDSESYAVFFRGILRDGSPRSDSLGADNDHFWFFNGQEGRSVTFDVNPAGDEDVYLELYNPNGQRLQAIDENGSGEAEGLADYTLLEDGLYAIRVAEFDFRPMNYTISAIVQ